MNVVMFYHSFASCWNHGNAHFLRGIARELIALGHRVTVYEPADGWSRSSALQDGGAAALAEAARLVPGVVSHLYQSRSLDLDGALEHADLVLVHEWNEPELVARLGARRVRGGRFLLLFHDTHHRAVTAPQEIERFSLEGYDGVLAFGEVLQQVYQRRGWGRRAFTWHEAADTRLFRPHPSAAPDEDLVWIGNWGDGERGEELQEFLIEPAARLRLSATIHGVRYPDSVRAELTSRNIRYAGWLPNHRVPDAFARARVTVHVPRRPYVEGLPGIPTIRVFEALACGIPLASAPWDDAEGLFPNGCYVTACDGEEMRAALSLVLRDEAFAAELAQAGLRAVRDRHTCAHRVQQLLDIVGGLSGRAGAARREPQGVASG